MAKWLIGLLLASPLLFGVALFVASEYGGETVELETFDDRGNSFYTKLWVVDFRGEPWLRAGDPEAVWLQRVEVNPEVVLIRGGERLPYRAEVARYESDRINEEMRARYGYADWLVSWIHDPAAVVAGRD